MAAQKHEIRMSDVARQAAYEALMEAADAWDALSPQERHLFVREHPGMVRVATLPSAWLRCRALGR